MLVSKKGLNGENGNGVAVFWYSQKKKQFELDRIAPSVTPPLTYHEEKPKKLTLAHSFTDYNAQSLLISGGKGASLALLTAALSINNNKLNFKVPPGFVLSVSAFELQIGRNRHLQAAIEKIKNIAFGIDTSATLESACIQATQAFTECTLDPEIVEIISSHYEKLQENNGDLRFAVRSSAIGEDSDDASSAGQNETYLGLTSLEAVLEAVKKCWASLYMYRSVEYRRQHIQPINTGMAVVVQQMVPSECAGVLFTKHPTIGDPSKILITANYGLGEVSPHNKVIAH